MLVKFLAQRLYVFQELIKVVLDKVDPGLLILLYLLQNRLILVFNFIVRFVQFLNALLVVLLGHLALVLGVDTFIHHFLYLVVIDFVLLALEKGFFYVDFVLFLLVAKAIVLLFAFLMLNVFLLYVHEDLVSLLKLLVTGSVVMLDVHVERFNQITSNQCNSVFHDDNQLLDGTPDHFT